MSHEVVAPGLLPHLPHALITAKVAAEPGVDPTVGLTDADVERQAAL
jgi:hypothetical protein